jgi:hypothetical protein
MHALSRREADRRARGAVGVAETSDAPRALHVAQRRRRCAIAVFLALLAGARGGVAQGGNLRAPYRAGARARRVALVIGGPAGGGRCAAIGIGPARDAIADDAELGAPSALRIRSALNAAERGIARAPGPASPRSTETPAAVPIHRPARSPTRNDDSPDEHDARKPTHHEILLDRALSATFAPARGPSLRPLPPRQAQCKDGKNKGAS